MNRTPSKLTSVCIHFPENGGRNFLVRISAMLSGKWQKVAECKMHSGKCKCIPESVNASWKASESVFGYPESVFGIQKVFLVSRKCFWVSRKCFGYSESKKQIPEIGFASRNVFITIRKAISNIRKLRNEFWILKTIF